MIAIEFEADVMDGMIKIPEKFHHMDKRHLKIIALLEQDESLVTDLKQESKIGVDTKSFFDGLKNRHFIVDRVCNIDEIMQAMND
jgi:uncharacterized protein (DUF2461 family)